MSGSATPIRMSPYAGEFVPEVSQQQQQPAKQTDAGCGGSAASVRPRRKSDPAVSVRLAGVLDKVNPRLPYQFQPGAVPKLPRKAQAPRPYLSSPAAALRMMVYDRLEVVGEQLGQRAAAEAQTQAETGGVGGDLSGAAGDKGGRQLAASGVGSLPYMVPIIREEGDRRVHSDIIHTFAKETARRDSAVPTEELVDVLGAAIFAFEQ
jgi:hypothetical protein